MKRSLISIAVACLLAPNSYAEGQLNDGSVLPFAQPPMEGEAKARLQDSTMKWPERPNYLPNNAPNILIILLDDVGFGVSKTFGGAVETPTFQQVADEGIVFNSFHTTSISSPTRASLLTGRNHTRIGSGTIAERAVAWDGYTGVIPKEAATIAEVLKNYGYKTSAFGKWHNTPVVETTAMGPKDRWPNGYGFEHFYGFLGGETSQYEPRLTQNYDAIEPPIDKGYHLSEDLAQQAVAWLEDHRSFSPDKPFFMYWAPGGAHGPHHVFKEWADKYKGQFNEGWDVYREQAFKRQKDLGIIPEDTILTKRDPTMASWESIPETQREFQIRLMELYAGFVEHTDVQVGKVIQGLSDLGMKDNTLIIYIFGDNGSSSEGQQGSISELLAQNNISNTIEQQINALERLGGLEALGTSATDNMYHAGWAWAGSTPFKGTKLLGAYFGGTRNPMAIAWPKSIKADNNVRNQFHHVIDVAPTIYELLGITAPEVVNGYKQIALDGVSFAYTFDDANAESVKKEQFFDNNGSRALYQDGWIASTFGPFIPWNTPLSAKTIPKWDSAEDEWELYNLNVDYSQATNLADKHPEKLKSMKARFLEVAKENQAYPIGAGNWLRIHPEDRVKTDYSEWEFTQRTERMPEFTAPGIGRESTVVNIDVDLPDKANGVIYAVGGASGGVTLYMEEGRLKYLYNMMIIEQYQATSKEPIPQGKHKITVLTDISGPGQSGNVQLLVDGETVAEVKLERTVPAAFSATESFDVGKDLGSTVSMDYHHSRPFSFDGTINRFNVRLGLE
ncbi:arylsulfatase [Vibrio campbellii]|uniref:arylsulfatase n=1 Tax=Vibrio campbellii TaxID=680 RepID=UPI0005EDF60E|nr:arylsulfatase [Vibrio campbellii]